MTPGVVMRSVLRDATVSFPHVSLVLRLSPVSRKFRIRDSSTSVYDHCRLRFFLLIESVEKPALFSNGGCVACAMEHADNGECLPAHLVVNGVGMMEHHAQPNTELFACGSYEW